MKKLASRSSVLILLMLIGLVSLPGQQDNDLKQIKAFFDVALAERQSHRWLEDLCAIGPRLSGSQSSLDAIAWVKQVMDTCGFDSVYLQEVMVPHWERGQAESAVLRGTSGRTFELSVLAIGGSVPTPVEGISAEVIEVKSLDDLDSRSEAEVAGKIVFYNFDFDPRNISTGASYGANVGMRAQGAVRAARKGAVASVIRSLTSARDDVPHTGTGSYEEDLDSIPAAALGVQSADLLHRVISQDPRARLTLKINSRWYPDAVSYNVIAEIRGHEYPDEIIVVGGHLDSWDVGQGAHDDGAGCMHSLGALKFMSDQVRNLRTIRAVMFINEENGTRGGQKYAELAKQKSERHLIAMESDAGGFSPRAFGFTGTDAQREKVMSWLPLFPRNTISYINKGGGGVDIGPLHRTTGTPMMGLIVDGQRAFDVHHSANDVFSSVHPREMELGTASLATMVYLLDKYGL